ncbi:MAG: NUDIX domain-containing protein [Haloarculaceae archaeon]
MEPDWIPETAFATCLRNAPQVCVDLVVAHDGGVLLARRRNEPAAGEWFWPGGRLRKGERFREAARRIASDELGLAVTVDEQLGASEHFWDTTSVSGVESRHTVPVVYRIEPRADLDVTLDDQHDDWRLLRTRESGLHQYVQAYLDRWDLLEDA